MTIAPILALVTLAAAPAQQYDVVVLGDTPCGIAAAIAAARGGCSVALVAEGRHVGGMMSSGLSITDVRIPSAHGGLFREFVGRVEAHYVKQYGADSPQHRACNGGLWFEPHLAEQVFEGMLAEQRGVQRFPGHRLVEAVRDGPRVTAIVVEEIATKHHATFEADAFIDATYEGDLAAAAGVAYRVGRESREEFSEPYAGRLFLKNPGLERLPGSTGEGDRRIQAYNYRLVMTDRPDLRVPILRPAKYDPEEFAPLVPLAQSGVLKGLGDVIRLAPIPNGKYGANNRPIVRSLDLPGANADWPEAGPERRREIVARYRDYTLGLLWFVQHDERLPESLRNDALRWGLCRDEFAENEHLPYSLYIREARRIVGRTTFTAHDALLVPGGERTPCHADSIAVADYHVDSHLVQRRQPGWPQVEGHVYLRPISKPAQVPFGIIVPREVEGLLVPGAVSASHLGFSVVRMEPVWMAMGQAAGTAAAIARERKTPVAEVPVPLLQRRLLEAGQVICFFYDVPGPDPIWMMQNLPAEKTRLDLVPDVPKPQPHPAVQYYGTKGYFATYFGRPNDPVTRSEAARWLHRFARKRISLQVGDQQHAFADVGPRHSDYDIVTTLRIAGVVDRWGDTEGFFPSAALSRADAANWLAALMRAARGWKPREGATSPWRDLAESTPGRDSLLLLHAHKALPEAWAAADAIDARHYVTRAEFCELLYRCESAETVRTPRD